MMIKLFIALCFLASSQFVFSETIFDSRKLSFERKEEVANFITHNELTYGFHLPLYIKSQISRFNKNATNSELFELLKHHNPVVRCYSFFALSKRQGIDLVSVLKEHVDDKEMVEVAYYDVINARQTVLQAFINIALFSEYVTDLEKETLRNEFDFKSDDFFDLSQPKTTSIPLQNRFSPLVLGQSEQALSQLTNLFNEYSKTNNKTEIKQIYQALQVAISPFYEELFWRFWLEQGLLSKEVFTFLHQQDPKKVYQIITQNPVHRYGGATSEVMTWLIERDYDLALSIMNDVILNATPYVLDLHVSNLIVVKDSTLLGAIQQRLDRASNSGICHSLYEIMIGYENEYALEILKQQIYKNKEPCNKTVLYYSLISDHPPFLDELLWEYWTEHNMLLEPIFNYLRLKDYQRTVKLSQKTLTNFEEFYFGNEFGELPRFYKAQTVKGMLDTVQQSNNAFAIEFIKSAIPAADIHLLQILIKKAKVLKEPSLFKALRQRAESESDENVLKLLLTAQ